VRILLDECVHRGVRDAFPGHAVTVVSDTDWRSSKDGPLLAFAERNFDVFVTIDRRLVEENRIDYLALGVILARIPNNKLSSWQPLFAALNQAAEKVRHGQVIRIPSVARRS
jgi:predicted nuclease of predicted toxin-antitoxin system